MRLRLPVKPVAPVLKRQEKEAIKTLWEPHPQRYRLTVLHANAIIMKTTVVWQVG